VEVKRWSGGRKEGSGGRSKKERKRKREAGAGGRKKHWEQYQVSVSGR
jgi:hypothetical protein